MHILSWSNDLEMSLTPISYTFEDDIRHKNVDMRNIYKNILLF